MLGLFDFVTKAEELVNLIISPSWSNKTTSQRMTQTTNGCFAPNFDTDFQFEGNFQSKKFELQESCVESHSAEAAIEIFKCK